MVNIRIICEVCKQEGYLQQLGNYYRIRHYQGKVEHGKRKFYYQKQSIAYVKAHVSSSDLDEAGKTLINECLYECAEAVK